MRLKGQTSPGELIWLGLIFGAVMIGAALLWAGLMRDYDWRAAWFPAGYALRELSAGIAAGMLMALLGWMVTLRVPALARLRDDLIALLRVEEMRVWHALILGALAAVPEEMFFRGTLQAEIGLLLAALLFAAMHAVSRLYFVYALLAGLMLGLLARWRGDLWAATGAHWSYDAAFFLLMVWRSKRNGTIIGN